MKPGHGDVLLAEGDPEVAEDEERLIEEFRRQLDLGMWAAVPTADGRPARGDDGPRLRRDPARTPSGSSSSRRRRRLRSSMRARRLAWRFGRATARSATVRRRVRPGPRASRRARARELLRSVVSATSTRCTRSSASSRSTAATASAATATCSTRTGRSSPTTPRTGELLNEYCVGFPDRSEPRAGQRLPDADDVLAKWMALRGDERELIVGGEHAPARAPARPRPGAARPDRLREWRGAAARSTPQRR